MAKFISGALALACFNAVSALPHVDQLETRQAGTTLTPIAFSDPLVVPTVVTNFPNGTWIENLVVRSADGNFVATVLSAPEVYLLSSDNSFDPVLLAKFPGYLGALGVVELGHDLFYAVVGNYSVTTATPTPGSFSIWELNLTSYNDCTKEQHWSTWKSGHVSRNCPQVTTKLVAEVPEAGLLNGMTVLNPNNGTVLVADSLYGTVWSVNVWTGDAFIAVNDTSMVPEADLSGGLALGVNGISVASGYLYYDNSNTVNFYRIPINATSGTATGPAELLVDNEFSNIFPDDFTLDFAGNAWLACEYGHIAFFEGVGSGNSPESIVAVAANATGPHGLTAAKFGTTEEDLIRGSLYVTTNGNPFLYGTDNPPQGQLVRYDTAVLGFN